MADVGSVPAFSHLHLAQRLRGEDGPAPGPMPVAAAGVAVAVVVVGSREYVWCTSEVDLFLSRLPLTKVVA